MRRKKYQTKMPKPVRLPPPKPDLQRIKDVLDEVETYNLPDGAYWALVHERLGMEYGDVFPIIGDNLEFFDGEPLDA